MPRLSRSSTASVMWGRGYRLRGTLCLQAVSGRRRGVPKGLVTPSGGQLGLAGRRPAHAHQPGGHIPAAGYHFRNPDNSTDINFQSILSHRVLWKGYLEISILTWAEYLRGHWVGASTGEAVGLSCTCTVPKFRLRCRLLFANLPMHLHPVRARSTDRK